MASVERKHLTGVVAGLIVLASGTVWGEPMQSGIERVSAGSDMPYSSAVKADGLIFVSGLTASDTLDGAVPADIKAQTRATLDRLAKTLERAGSSLGRAAAVMVYLKNASDFAAMNEVYATYFAKDPPTRTTVVAGLIRPEWLIEISAVALPPGAPREVVHPASWQKSPNPYSYGIKSGDTLFLSGLVSRNGRDNAVVTGDMTVQTMTVLDNAGEILAAAGMTRADVVSSRVFITDQQAFQAMNAAYRTYFPKEPPVRATVLCPLMNDAYLVEITMVAVKGGGRRVVVPTQPDGTTAAPNPNLSPAIRVGNRLYVSGMLGNTDANKGDIKGQTKETLDRIGRALAAADADWSHVVDAIVYMTDLSQWGAMNEVWRPYFTAGVPARAAVRTGLVAPDGIIEIMVTAVKP